jgi:threonine dehydrogenase-like Zn-dependent dehydrogenase
VVVNNRRDDALAAVMDLTGGLGADVAIEAVGVLLGLFGRGLAAVTRRSRHTTGDETRET